jgi:hypothetical protein
MESNHHIWRGWAVNLHKWGLHEVAATFLEATGPLALLAAQFVYLSEPVLNGLAPAGTSRALVGLLEDDAGRADFLQILNEEGQA